MRVGKARKQAAAIVKILCEEFPDQADELERPWVAAAIARQLRRPEPWFEIIVDHPAAANWRLKPAPDGGIRLADYRLSSIDGPRAQREITVNDAIAAI